MKQKPYIAKTSLCCSLHASGGSCTTHGACSAQHLSIENPTRRCLLVDQAQEFNCSYFSISVGVECERHQTILDKAFTE